MGETSLIFKTFLILASQLAIVFGVAYGFVHRCRRAFRQGEAFLGIEFTERFNDASESDLVPGEINRNAFNSILFLWFGIAMLMVFWDPEDVSIRLTLMTLSSLSFGGLLGLILIIADENDGLRTIKLALGITVLTAVIGLYSGVDLGWMREGLFAALVLLIVWHLATLVFSFSRSKQRLVALGGSILFILFLLYDFNRLAQLDEAGVNNWAVALEMATHLYLDVLNLVLEIMAAGE